MEHHERDGLAGLADQIVPFALAAGTPGHPHVAFTPGEAGALLWGSDLKDPGAGKVYEVWMIANGSTCLGGCLRPTDGSVRPLSTRTSATPREMAVTVESASCPGAPPRTDHDRRADRVGHPASIWRNTSRRMPPAAK